MRKEDNQPLPELPASRVQAVAAVVLIGWRLLDQPASALWRDWALILSAYWLLVALKPGSTILPRLTTSVATFLLAIYIVGQLPHTLRSLGFLGP